MAQEDAFEKIVGHCKEYGFVFPSNDIYDGLAAVYDYGQDGVELKGNIKRYWWQSMVLLHSDVVGIDASVFMHPTVWRASGHIDAFNNPLIDNRDSKKHYHAGNLIEDQIGKYEEKIEREAAKAVKKFGESFNEAKFRETNPRVPESQKERDDPHACYTEAMQGPDLEASKQIIFDGDIVNPISDTTNWIDVRRFNLMSSTEMGASADTTNRIYLCPETAQGIFVSFLNIQKTGRMGLPFDICQTGETFHDEIVACQFVLRVRKLEQMEIQFFCQPRTEMKWFEYWEKHCSTWHEGLGMGSENYRFHDREKLAHYANAATGIKPHMPFGLKEIEGIHSRTNFDLSQHEKYSGRQVRYFNPERNENYTPYVVEASIDVDHVFLLVMCHNYTEEALRNGSSRVVLKLPEPLAPVKYTVLLLVNRDDLPEKAQETVNSLKFHFSTHMEAKGSIGKRYRRQDATGTPFCVIVDGDTLTGSTIILRYRDSTKQERIPVEKLREIIENRVSITALSKKINID